MTTDNGYFNIFHVKPLEHRNTGNDITSDLCHWLERITLTFSNNLLFHKKICTPLLKDCSFGDNYSACFVSTQPLRGGHFQAALRASFAKKWSSEREDTSWLAMNSLHSSNHKKEGKRNLFKKIWTMPGFEPSTATLNTNAVYYGDIFSKGKIKII